MPPGYPEHINDFEILRDAYYSKIPEKNPTAKYRPGIWHGEWKDNATTGAEKKPSRFTMRFVERYSGWTQEQVEELEKQVRHARNRIKKAGVQWTQDLSRRHERADPAIKPIIAAWKDAMNVDVTGELGEKLGDVVYGMLLVAFTSGRPEAGSSSPAQSSRVCRSSASSADASRAIQSTLGKRRRHSPSPQSHSPSSTRTGAGGETRWPVMPPCSKLDDDDILIEHSITDDDARTVHYSRFIPEGYEKKFRHINEKLVEDFLIRKMSYNPNRHIITAYPQTANSWPVGRSVTTETRLGMLALSMHKNDEFPIRFKIIERPDTPFISPLVSGKRVRTVAEFGTTGEEDGKDEAYTSSHIRRLLHGS